MHQKLTYQKHKKRVKSNNKLIKK